VMISYRVARDVFVSEIEIAQDAERGQAVLPTIAEIQSECAIWGHSCERQSPGGRRHRAGG
jgi:hypothetical protein